MMPLSPRVDTEVLVMNHTGQDQVHQGLEIRVAITYQKIRKYNVIQAKSPCPGVPVQGQVKVGILRKDLMRGQKQEGCTGFQVGMGIDKEMSLGPIGIKLEWTDQA